MRISLIRMLTVCVAILGAISAMLGFAKSEGSSDLDQVKAANQSYYAALSARDLSAMERVWAMGPRDVNVAPPIKPAAHPGWDAIKKNYHILGDARRTDCVDGGTPYCRSGIGGMGLRHRAI